MTPEQFRVYIGEVLMYYQVTTFEDAFDLAGDLANSQAVRRGLKDRDNGTHMVTVEWDG